MQTVREHIRAGTHPSCATKKQFLTWANSVPFKRAPLPRYFCDECTASYEATMKLAGRCDKHRVGAAQ